MTSKPEFVYIIFKNGKITGYTDCPKKAKIISEFTACKCMDKLKKANEQLIVELIRQPNELTPDTLIVQTTNVGILWSNINREYTISIAMINRIPDPTSPMLTVISEYAHRSINQSGSAVATGAVATGAATATDPAVPVNPVISDNLADRTLSPPVPPPPPMTHYNVRKTMKKPKQQ